MDELDLGVVVLDDHRRGEIAQQRRHGRLIETEPDIFEDEALFRLPNRQHARALAEHVAAVGPHQSHGERNVKGQLSLLSRRRRAGLLHRERVALCARVVLALHPEHGRSRLVVPAHELRQLGARGVRHRPDEIVAGDGLPVVAREIELHALAKVFRADQRADHAHHLGALFVDGGGVEVADLQVGAGPHRMRHRPGVFGELRGAQVPYFADALHRARVQVRAEFLLAEHGEPLLERQLEPVAAGDAVSRPIVEILVRDDPVDGEEIGVGRGIGPREHVLGVEEIEALVLHRSGVEVAHGDDRVMVEIHFEAESLLVPLHGALQGPHGEAALVELAGIDVDRELHAASRARDEAVLQLFQLRRHHREEIARLGEGIVPPQPAAAVRLGSARDRVAVREQHRIFLAVGVDRHRVLRHHVGPVEEIRDAPEAFRLALGEEPALRGVQSHELGVPARPDAAQDLERAALGDLRDRQVLLVERVLARRKRAAVQRHRLELKLLTVDPEELEKKDPEIKKRFVELFGA